MSANVGLLPLLPLLLLLLLLFVLLFDGPEAAVSGCALTAATSGSDWLLESAATKTSKSLSTSSNRDARRATLGLVERASGCIVWRVCVFVFVRLIRACCSMSRLECECGHLRL